MSKPIFIVRFPYIEDINRAKYEKHYEEIAKRLPDYHVLSVLDNRTERIEFECFNAPHTEIEFDNLKQLVMETLNKSLNSLPEHK